MYARKERLRIEKIEDELRRDVELMNKPEISFDSINRPWALCPLCKKKSPAWGLKNPEKDFICKCQRGY